MTKQISQYVKSFLMLGLALSTLVGTAAAKGVPVSRRLPSLSVQVNAV